MLLKSRNGGFFMQITDFSPSLARVRTISDTAVATAPASASDENISSTTPQKNNNLGAPNTVWASFRN